MQAQLTVIPPKRPVFSYQLGADQCYLIGRAAENDVIIAEPSVSRQHARLALAGPCWTLSDLNSVNGIRCNGMMQQYCVLDAEAMVLIGNVPVLFSASSTEVYQQQHRLDSWRRQQVNQMTEQIAKAQLSINDLLSQAIQLCKMQRAGLLLGNEFNALRLVSSVGVASAALQQGFFGSQGALYSVMQTTQPLVCHDINQYQALAQRDSVKLKQITALACLPILHQNRLLGLFYTDSHQCSRFLSELDMELLQTLVNQLALMLCADEINSQLEKFITDLRQINEKPLL